jgi:tRNA-Thr(GGU) m(6)t(6)A37 methyltransferase TsaA
MRFELEQIATIKSPFCNLVNMPVQPKGAKDVYGTIDFKKEYEVGLKDLDGFSHLYLIYYFHKVKNHQLQVIPFNDKTDNPRGVFATRTPMHPNGLGLSVVELVKVEKNIVIVKGVDILDGTPLLDIKPYIENFDKIQGEVKSGWMKSTSNEIAHKRSDSRFIE